MTFHDQEMKINDVSKQHTYPNKLYMTCGYSSYNCQEDKTTAGVFTHISQQSVQHDFILELTGTEFLSAVVKIP